MKKTADKDAGVIFQNPILEFLSKTSPLITFFWVGFYVFILFLANSVLNPDMSILSMVLWFALGMIVWTFFEYFLHRYLFHWSSESKLITRMTYVLHGIHHEFPHDERRVFMPPAPGTIFVLLFLGIFWIFMQNDVFVFLPGFLTGYFIYAYIHYMIHAKRPFRNFKFWWTHHSLHHYKYQDKAFGVSSPIWDIIFDTMPPKTKKTDIH